MQTIRKFNYNNHPMNLPKKGLGDLLKKNAPGIGAGLSTASGMVDTLNPKSKIGGDIASGAMKGAASGLMIAGPWGAAAGAVIGGAVSIFAHKAEERKAEKEAAEIEAKRVEAITATNDNATQNILRNFSSSGVDRPRADKGGDVKTLLSQDELKKHKQYRYTNEYVNKYREAVNYVDSVRVNHLTPALIKKAGTDSIDKVSNDVNLTNKEFAATFKTDQGKKDFADKLRFLSDENTAHLNNSAGKAAGKNEKPDTNLADQLYGNRLAKYQWENVKLPLKEKINDGPQVLLGYRSVYDDENPAPATVRKALGGKIVPGQADYLAEEGETIQHDPNAIPETDKFGHLNRISSDTSLIKGATHDAKSGGVGMKGGDRIFSNDNKLKVPKDFSKILKKL